MVLIVLVGEVYKPPLLGKLGKEFCPRGPRMAAQHGTSNGGGTSENLMHMWPTFQDKATGGCIEQKTLQP